MSGIDCSACAGNGHNGSSLCVPCSGTGAAKCHDCPSPATLATTWGPSCSDCAPQCFFDCGSVATHLIVAADDQGENEKVRDFCADCVSLVEEREERVARTKRRAAYEAACDSVRKERSEEGRAA